MKKVTKNVVRLKANCEKKKQNK